MIKIILLICITVIFFSCYKTKEEPSSLDNEYLSVADFKEYYTQKQNTFSFKDSVRCKIKGYINKEYYTEFLKNLELIKDDTINISDTNIYFIISDYKAGYGDMYGERISVPSKVNISFLKLYNFFKNNENNNYIYLSGIVETRQRAWDAFPNSYPVYYLTNINIIDTIDIKFINK